MVHSLASALESWRQDHLGLPVLTWKAFHDKVRSSVNPLVSEDQLRDVTNALHKMGEVSVRMFSTACDVGVYTWVLGHLGNCSFFAAILSF